MGCCDGAGGFFAGYQGVGGFVEAGAEVSEMVYENWILEDLKRGLSYVSMKFTPMYSFLTRISPSLSSGTGRSVFHFRTSGPPGSSKTMPDMVLGIGGMIAVSGGRTG